jgi:hypothetical protein
MSDKQPQKRKENRPGRKLGVKVKHGAYSLIARGTLPRKRRYLERFLGDVRQGLIKDLGPKEENLTTAQLILIDRIIGKLGVLRCAEEFVRESGVVKGQELSPILKRSYLSWANSLRLDLQALGIDKRQSEPGLTLAEIIAEHDRAQGEPKSKEGKDT